MNKHHNRPRLLTSHDKPLDISPFQAQDMIDRGEAVIVSMTPLIIREARFLEYRDEARRSKGEIIPGVEHPNPSRMTESEVKRARKRYGSVLRSFESPTSEGSSQGVCFPPERLFPAWQREYNLYRKHYKPQSTKKAKRGHVQQGQLIEDPDALVAEIKAKRRYH